MRVNRLILSFLGLCLVSAGLMSAPATASTSHSLIIEYPGFRQFNPRIDRSSGARIDMINNKGVVNELLINCGDGRSGILIESKIEGLYCGPDHRCVPNLVRAVRRLCR